MADKAVVLVETILTTMAMVLAATEVKIHPTIEMAGVLQIMPIQTIPTTTSPIGSNLTAMSLFQDIKDILGVSAIKFYKEFWQHLELTSLIATPSFANIGQTITNNFLKRSN
jgi:hypothetical protein